LKILLITNLFAPDELAGASLYSDLAFYLKNQGSDIRVLCTFSYYPAWSLIPEDEGVSVRDESWHGIPVRRISMYVPKNPSGLKRIVSDLSFFLSIIRRNFCDDWHPDVVITALPMFSQCMAQRFLYRGCSIPRIIIVQDFVLDAALELGLLNLPGIAFPLRLLEKWSLRSADTLSTISQQMLKKLRSIVGSDRRLLYIPNWIHESLAQKIRVQSQDRPSRREQTLLYSGNLGVKQGLPDFIETFIKSSTGWNLRVHGGGADKDRLFEATRGQGAIRVQGVLNEADYVSELLTCTASLVTQMPGLGANFLPSKLLPAIAAGTPVLAICDPNSPLGIEVRKGEFGEVISPADVIGLKTLLKKWADNPGILEKYSENALQRAIIYSRDKILPQYEQELLRLINTNKKLKKIR